jgi:Antitoxin FitA-like, ribbon-helix-helix
MPSLTIRDIPEPILRQMRRAAKAERRSLNSQAVRWLEERATQWKNTTDIHNLVASIRAEREAMFRRHGQEIDSVELVRRSRRRGQD